MQSEECRHITGVNAARVHCYDFFQLAGLLGAPGWRNGLSLAFPPSDVAALEAGAVTPACIGLLGMAGALPYHYTEAIARTGGPAARALMDLLSAPAIDLFCAAWREGCPGYAPLPAIAAQRGPLRARALAERFAQALNVPIRVEQFAGQWESLPRGQCSTLGVSNASCGAGAIAGERFWRLDSAVRIHIGPVSGEAAQAFIPGGRGALALAQLWRSAAGGSALRAEARIHTRAETGARTRLGAAVRLGHDALLGAQPAGVRDDLRYRLC